MKDKMKNTLEHEVELLGRSVSVLLIAGLLVVGGASAALLNSFGEITGEADIEQAVVIDEAGDDLQASWGLPSDSFTAGEEVSGEPISLTSNLEDEESIEFKAPLEHELNVDDSVTSDGGYDAGYSLLVNAETFGEVENSIDAQSDDGSASASYVYEDNQVAVNAEFESDDEEESHVHAGLWADVERTVADDVTISAETVDAENDWFYAVGEITEDQGTFETTEEDTVELDEDTVILFGDFSPDDDSVVLSDFQESTVYVVDEQDLDEIDSRGDFTKDTRLEEGDSEQGGEDLDTANVDVEYVVAATGTVGGDGDLTYTDFSVNLEEEDGKDLFRTLEAETFTEDVPPGTHELGFAADFDIAAAPGNYDFDLVVNTPE